MSDYKTIGRIRLVSGEHDLTPHTAKLVCLKDSGRSKHSTKLDTGTSNISSMNENTKVDKVEAV